MLIKSSTRTYDITGRYGGDEFIIIMVDTNLENTFTVAEELRKKIEKNKIKTDTDEISFTSGFGIASLIEYDTYICSLLKINSLIDIYEIKNPKEQNWEEIERYKSDIVNILFKMADSALYKAKQSQCNSCGLLSRDRNFLSKENVRNAAA